MMDKPAPIREAQRDEGQAPVPSVADESRQEKWGLYVLAALILSFSALGAYGIVNDDGPLEVLAFCGSMPTLLGFLVLLGMHMTWLE